MTDPGRRAMTLKAKPAAGVVDAGRDILVGLIGAVAQGHESALHRLYQLTAAKLNGIVSALLRDPALAEEVLQDTFMNVWRHAPSFDPSISSPITWLAAIARNRAIDRLRAERRHRAAASIDDHAPADEADPPLERLLAAEASQGLRRCLARLDPELERAIRAAFFGGLTYDELATREGVPLPTMKSRIRRGLLRLRACMDAQ